MKTEKEIKNKIKEHTETWKKYVKLKDTSMAIWFHAKKEALKWVLED